MGVVEQQLGEKPPRTSTCSEEENPRPAEPHIQKPPGLGHKIMRILKGQF